MLTIAFYTEGTPYEQEAELFRSSLDNVGMEHNIVGVKDRGGWYENTRYKAEFIREQRYSQHGPLLYIDVDAYVHSNCDAYFEGLARKGVDFGAHWFRGPAKGYDKTKLKDEGWWMLSGTLFLGDTRGARELCDNWFRLNQFLRYIAVQEGGGQKNLWYLVTCMEDLNVERLPGRYTYVYDKPWAYPTGEPCIIEHTIASRENRPNRRQPANFGGRVNPARQQRIAELRHAC